MQKRTMLIAGVAAAALAAVGAGTFATAQQAGGADVIGELANNEGIFVDGKTFKIARGKAKGDPAAQIAKLGAKEVGPGAIVFRYNDKLYMVEGNPVPPPQAMKNFQDNWNTSYMKAMKDFQENWSVSYMKDFQSNWNVSYAKDFQDNWNTSYMKAMKDFQDNWNTSYLKAMKEFQDNWNVSYMKDFQSNWNVSYMKTVKDFQDNWTTTYMK
ncbi:MAG: hypothetical protein C5B56_10210 [Proteobacteria bacterium]|nr:MAG: hypothetical protein C5B56_10210 [Pseudomonadota bacterium]